jgi:hypothetical protein
MPQTCLISAGELGRSSAGLGFGGTEVSSARCQNTFSWILVSLESEEVQGLTTQVELRELGVVWYTKIRPDEDGSSYLGLREFGVVSAQRLVK